MTFDVHGHVFPALDEQVTGRLEELHRQAVQPGGSEAMGLSGRSHPIKRAR